MDYNGDATVVADGTEYACKASLRRGYNTVRTAQGETLRGLGWWRGTLDVDGLSTAFAVMGASEPRLRIGDREASFVPTETTPHGIRIAGNGAAPFGPQD